MKVKTTQLTINKTSTVSDFIFLKSTSYDSVKHHKQKNTLIFSFEIRKKAKPRIHYVSPGALNVNVSANHFKTMATVVSLGKFLIYMQLYHRRSFHILHK